MKKRNCTGPVANLVDFVSVLQKLPSPMLSRGKRLHQGLVDTYGGIIEETKQKLQRGISVDACLAKSLIEMRVEESLDDLDMAIMASAFLIGGVETVRSKVAVSVFRKSTDSYRRLPSCNGSLHLFLHIQRSRKRHKQS